MNPSSRRFSKALTSILTVVTLAIASPAEINAEAHQSFSTIPSLLLGHYEVTMSYDVLTDHPAD